MKKSLAFIVLVIAHLLTGCGGGDEESAAPTYTISGGVSGLEGSGLVLQNNAGDNLGISSNGRFTFATPLADKSRYSVTVLTQPASPNQICDATNGEGIIGGTNVIETSTNADVYPILIFARDAYGIVPLKGKSSIVPMMLICGQTQA